MTNEPRRVNGPVAIVRVFEIAAPMSAKMAAKNVDLARRAAHDVENMRCV